MKDKLLITALAGITLAGSAQAAPIVDGTAIGVDFGPTASTNDFNDVTTASGSITAGSVIDTSTVVVDGVGFTWGSVPGAGNSGNGTFLNNDADETQASLPTEFNSSNTTDWLGLTSSTRPSPNVITLTFTGLNDGFTYDLIIGASFTNNAPNTFWEVDGQSATTDADAAGSSYVSFTGLETNGAGNLLITGTGTGGVGGRHDLPTVAALHLTAVPEPGSLALLAAGGLMMLKRRRRA